MCTSVAVTLTPLRISAAAWAKPLDTLNAAHRAALRADWPLRQWDEFSRTARATLTAAASDAELEEFRAVVRQWFEVDVQA